MVQKTKNIAFIIPEDFSWKGEENYFKSLISTIDKEKNLNIKIFTSKKCKKKFKQYRFNNAKIITSTFFEKNNFLNFLRKEFNFIF